jgi:hypothetical protein
MNPAANRDPSPTSLRQIAGQDAPTLNAPGRLHCFLEEFAGDAEFVRPSDPEQLPHSVAAPGSIVSNAIGRQVELEEFN